MAIKVVVFDLGNVVELHLYNQFSSVMAKKYNVPKEKFKRIFLKNLRKTDKRTLPETKLVAQIGKELGKGMNERDFFKQQRAHCVPNKEAVQLVDALKGKYTLVLFSNLNKMHAGWSERQLHLKKRFDLILFSYQYKTRKPEVKFYKILLKKLKVRPEEILFIDDNNRNLKPARKLGIRTVLFTGNVAKIRKILKRIIESESTMFASGDVLKKDWENKADEHWNKV